MSAAGMRIVATADLGKSKWSLPKYIYKVLVSPRKTFRMGEKRNIHVLYGNLVNLF